MKFHLLAQAAAYLLTACSAQGAAVSWVRPNGSFWDLADNWSLALSSTADDALVGGFDNSARSLPNRLSAR
ncbi:hypothetical protein [Piscinibacter sp.]|uniref:hypothetical protein n=1 Tax=Piscinibacter sp. TaxID=1903157 RepID=UPI002D7E3EA5|nr:hypothetical protein [Albitalea sp.]